jgi:tetratricopeptide (TPR) repeat protein
LRNEAMKMRAVMGITFWGMLFCFPVFIRGDENPNTTPSTNQPSIPGGANLLNQDIVKPEDQYNEGLRYRGGNGVAKDMVEAVKWFRRAAIQGNRDAELEVALCYYNGHGVDIDKAESAKWFRKAADQNSSVAQHYLAGLYLSGLGILKDEVEGLAWLYVSSANGNEGSAADLSKYESQYGSDIITAARVRAAKLQVIISSTSTPNDFDGSASDYLTRATDAMSKGDTRTALANLDKVIRLDPKQSEAYFYREIIRRATGDTQGAQEDLRTFYDLGPTPVVWCEIGTVMIRMRKDVDAAIDCYNKAISLNTNFAPAYYDRAIAREAKQDLKGAIEDYSKSINLDPNDADSYDRRGLALARLNDFDGAITDLTKAIELKVSPIVGAYLGRGLAKMAKHDFDGAISDFNTGIKLAPDQPDGYEGLGRVEAYLDQYDSAIRNFDIAIQLRPNHPDDYRFRALAKKLKGDEAGSIADYKKAEELSSQ